MFFVSFRQPTVIEIFTSSVEEDGSGSVRHSIRVTTNIRCGGLESEGNQMCTSDDLVKDMLLEWGWRVKPAECVDGVRVRVEDVLEDVEHGWSTHRKSSLVDHQ